MCSTHIMKAGPLPIVPLEKASLSPAELGRVQSLARCLLRDEPALAAADAFGPRVRSGIGPGPSLFYEDHSEIPLARAWTSGAHKYRIAMLAGDGDLLVVSAPRAPSFEAYMRNTLGLGSVEIITLAADTDGPAVPVVKKLLGDSAAMALIVERARRAGFINIIPYIGYGGVWRLAAKIAAQSGAEVRVTAPAPRLARRINDKLWFSSQVEALLGRQALPPTQTTFGPAAMAARVARFARTNAQVVIKVPDSAGSFGNVVIASGTILGLDLSGVRDLILGFLKATGWRQTFPLMVGVWEIPVIMSPSVQIWIPEKADGPPVIEGMFIQKIVGARGKFAGAERLDPAPPWGGRILREAMMLATLLQEIGYFGRCSLDALLVGKEEADVVLHWVECNGRWGGVSVPMTLANRLSRDRKRAPFVVIQHYTGITAQRDFEYVQSLLDGHLLRRGSDTGVVVLTPCGATDGTGCDFMVIERDPAAAMAKAEDVIRILDSDNANAPPPVAVSPSGLFEQRGRHAQSLIVEP